MEKISKIVIFFWSLALFRRKSNNCLVRIRNTVKKKKKKKEWEGGGAFLFVKAISFSWKLAILFVYELRFKDVCAVFNKEKGTIILRSFSIFHYSVLAQEDIRCSPIICSKERRQKNLWTLEKNLWTSFCIKLSLLQKKSSLSLSISKLNLLTTKKNCEEKTSGSQSFQRKSFLLLEAIPFSGSCFV